MFFLYSNYASDYWKEQTTHKGSFGSIRHCHDVINAEQLGTGLDTKNLSDVIALTRGWAGFAVLSLLSGTQWMTQIIKILGCRCTYEDGIYIYCYATKTISYSPCFALTHMTNGTLHAWGVQDWWYYLEMYKITDMQVIADSLSITFLFSNPLTNTLGCLYIMTLLSS